MYLISKEGDKLFVSQSIIEQNTFLRVITDIGNEETEISISYVPTRELAKVIEFCNYYDRNPFTPISKPILHTDIHNIFEDIWYCTFVDIPIEDLFSLINVANYLDNQPLLDLLSSKIVTMVRGRSTSEIQEILLQDARTQ